MKQYSFVLSMISALSLAGCRDSNPIPRSALPPDVTLSPDSARHALPSYSPDGARVAYWTPAADSTQDWILTIANADLSAPQAFDVRVSRPESAVWSVDGTRLAAMSSQYGNPDVVQLTLSTGEVKRLTSDPGLESPSAWSRDGRTLTYVRSSPNGSIRSDDISLADGKSRPVLEGELLPHTVQRSPDGSHVAFLRGDGSSYTIWLADSLGENRRPLTSEGLEFFVANGWSPDSKHFLYYSNRTGTSDLWVASIDGTPPRQLTRNVRNDYGGAWSPDGKSIAFLSDRGKQMDIWVIPAQGGEERRVTNSAAEERGPLVWRNGTSELTFSVPSEKTTLWAVDLGSGQERQLTPDTMSPRDWWASPDGSQMAVILESGGGMSELTLVPLTGGAARTLLSVQAFIERPLFSPDGSQLVYSSDAGGTPGIWVIDVKGGAPRELTKGGIARLPVWSEDGASIFYVHDRESRIADVWKVPAAGGSAIRLTRDGGIWDLMGRAGYPGIYVQRISQKGGMFNVMRLRDDGTLLPIWTQSNAGSMMPLSQDSLVALVEQPDGKMRGMLLSTAGSGGRVLLKSNETLAWPSRDGKFLVYTMPVGGANDVAILTLADGSVRRVTTSPQDERGPGITKDGKTVTFARRRYVQRIHSVNMKALLSTLAAPQK